MQRLRLLLLLGLSFLLCAAVAQPAVLTLHQADLATDSTGRPPTLFAPTPVQLPHDWSDEGPHFKGEHWYQLVFDDPGAADPAVYLERVCTNAEVWINGTLVGSGGAMVGSVARNCYYPQLYRFARSLLVERGNRMDIHVLGLPLAQVAARQRGGGVSRVQIGPESELRGRYESRYFWNITVAQILGASMVLFGIAIVSLGWVRRQDRHYLYFGATQVLWGLLGLRLYVQQVPWSLANTEIVIASVFPWVVFAVVQFLLHYIGLVRRWVVGLLVTQGVVVPLVFLAVPPDRVFLVASSIYTLLALEFCVALAVFTWQGWRVQRRAFWIFGAIELLLLLLVGAEIAVQNEWLPLPRIHLIHFAMPVLFLGIGLHLVQQFAAALTQSERLNRELEQRVADKTQEIENNYAQMSVLRANQAVADERQRIAADLHDDLGAKLVTIAQASLYANDIGRITTLARQALDDMRLSVGGLTGALAPVPEVLADWRAETVERLTLAGLVVHWTASDASIEWLLPARIRVQLTRVLREAVTNVISHSGASVCWVTVHAAPDHLRVCVQDNGRGHDTQRVSPGHGLPGIARRARLLDGVLDIGPREGGGFQISLCIALPRAASGNPSPRENMH